MTEIECTFKYNSNEIIKKIEETRENKLWIETKINEFREKYPNKYVAIYKKRIVGSHSNPKLLIKLLRKDKKLSNNMDMIMIEFITGEDHYLIL